MYRLYIPTTTAIMVIVPVPMLKVSVPTITTAVVMVVLLVKMSKFL